MTAPTERGEAVLASVAFATERFLRGAAWTEAIDEVLEHLGKSADADRALLVQNVRGPDGALWMDLLGAWDRAGIEPMAGRPRGHAFPYFPSFGRWIEILGRGEAVVGSVEGLPGGEQAELAAGKVRSIIRVPVRVGDEWWGFVGFDDCREAREWTELEVAGLRAAAEAIAAGVVREREEDMRRYAEDAYRSMIEKGPVVTYIDAVDDAASTIYISPQVEAMLGYAPEEWRADPDLWPKLLHPDDRARAVAENVRHNETGEHLRMEYRMIAKDGRVVWVHDEARMERDERGVPRYSHGVMFDITSRKQSEGDLAFLSYHDPLTGLPSRAMFEELLELSLARARRHDGAVAVFCVDVDDFRLVNDSLGHQHGDAVLKLVAERLREATRETDFVARRGGDQFLLLLADLTRDGETDGAMIRIESVTQRIQEAMAAPFQVADTELYVSLSIGVSVFPQDAQEPGTLQRNAEAAMYESKKSGPGGYVVSSRGAFDSAAKLQFVTRLRKAVDSQRWVLHYQPVLELETNTMVGVEALIRWIEPDGTMVPPADFIPLAEELGLIEVIGDWVVRELVYQIKAWKELGIDLEVGFNLSPRQFWQPDLSERILERIRAGGIQPDRLVVEITETSAMMDPDRAQEIIWKLHHAGLKIAIDDFGTGYSSLSRLRDLPVEVLKIDRSFVRNVNGDDQAASIVSAFIELARGLRMSTLAEGIESPQELQLLRDRGCELGQGFVFSKPVPPEEIISFAIAGLPFPSVV
jgi:diguanylate cyclase (GGDEF)-like protein/PAS domain S-box-containing protein